jgi:hypothetical protein
LDHLPYRITIKLGLLRDDQDIGATRMRYRERFHEVGAPTCQT